MEIIWKRKVFFIFSYTRQDIYDIGFWTIYFYFSDYRPMPALDRYDPDVVDDEEYSEMSQGERAVAEAIMLKRDRAAGIIRDDRYLLYGIF